MQETRFRGVGELRVHPSQRNVMPSLTTISTMRRAVSAAKIRNGARGVTGVSA
jgi:hypothetical protein